MSAAVTVPTVMPSVVQLSSD